jgi:hypothetical protein
MKENSGFREAGEAGGSTTKGHDAADTRFLIAAAAYQLDTYSDFSRHV